MLSDRPSYLRDDYKRERTSVVNWLISALIAGFVLQVLLASRWFHSEDAVYQLIGLSIPSLQDWRLWTLFTHSFLHSPSFIFHAVGNVLLLYFLGRELLPLIGARRMVGIFAAATAVGGLVWTAVHWRFGGGDTLIGATAAVYAFVVIYACFFPHQELRFWLFFVVPVTLKPKHVAYTLAGFDLFGLLLFEIPGSKLPLGMVIANSAHLGGMLTGYLYYRFLHEAGWRLGGARRPDVELPRWVKPARKSSAKAVEVPANASPNRVDLRAEVDRILDKINSHGFASLTAAEKRVLDNARNTISRH